MKKILLKGLLLTFPFLLLLGYFLIEDPMKVVYPTESPLEKGVLINDRLYQYRWLYSKPYPYNAFIFGSSRSKAFHTDVWSRYLKNAVPFHMGVNDETLLGLSKKIKALPEMGYKVDYALLTLDYRLLSLIREHSGHIMLEHYKVSGTSTLEYYKAFFTAFLKPDFLRAYYLWETQGFADQSLNNYIFTEDFAYDKKTGDHRYFGFEEELKKDSLSYYRNRTNRFYQRNQEKQNEAPQIIGEEQKKLLLDILSSFKKLQTRYKIIITPNYDQLKFNKKDFLWLSENFGQRNVFDFSGINEMTKDVGNYYEERHFKPYIANKIIDNVYTEK